ncbi:NUDIX domain-containing protein [Vibrio sonorensis]|uniref:NUDIX domain-containing protein n=1 Tax=Vibrio sonorensis TaxID=1004316 RepID=UPI0008D90AA6|nr:NUDIX domain-containing protein [Vibrio sonorensis]
MEHRIRAAGILLNNDAILMVKVKDYTGEYWIPPGGGLEAGDRSTKGALEREFEEETGLKVEVGQLICVREFVEAEPERYHAEFFYQIDSYTGEIHINNLQGLTDEHFIQAVEWVELKSLKQKRTYPSDLHDILVPNVISKTYSLHLGCYVQGSDEQTNHLDKPSE